MSDSNKRRRKQLFLLALCIAAGMLIYSFGSRSWNLAEKQSQETSEKKDQKKKKPLPDFLTRTPVLLPGVFQRDVRTNDFLKNQQQSDPVERLFSDPSNSAMRLNRAKAGHWYSTYYPVVANHLNIEGDLTTQTVLPTGQPVPVPGTQHWSLHERPVSLAKKEWKNLENSVYVPVRSDTTMNTPSVLVSFSIEQQNATLNQASTIQPIAGMKPFQHHFVVLGNRPDDWSFLKLTDSFQLASQLGNGDSHPAVYFLVPSIPGDPVPLPRNPLQWTTIAYVLWDNLPSNALDSMQQSALIDWLHHGGQLILSGPDCLDELRAGFLADYLPASFDGLVNLTADDVDDLNKHWSIPTKTGQDRRLTISPTSPIPGVRFDPHVEASYIDGTGEIAIERRIGRGRIVLTAFSLNSHKIRDWGSFQSFLNGALLRKPSRQFELNSNLETMFSYQGNSTSMYDPLMSSTVRFLSRDLGTSGTDVHTDAASSEVQSGSDTESSGVRNLVDTWHYGGYQDQPISGVGGWNDFSGIANAARDALRERAGIQPPSAEFVLKMLSTYLIALVPLNWLVFRSVGRVEYAWLAAPIISIAGAIGVVRLASLDIGFARSNTELGLLEIFSDHQRGHLTQYSALYTSLTTRYQAELNNSTSQALPFAVSRNSGYFVPNQKSYSKVTLKRTVQNRLEDLLVQSNSTGLLHVESMLDLEGTFSIHNSRSITNSSPISLDAAGVARCSDNGQQFEVAWIGDLLAGQTVDLNFEKTTFDDLYNRWLINPKLASTMRRARVIWKNNVPDSRNYISRESMLEFPEIQDDIDQFQVMARLMEPSLAANGFSFDDFRNIYSDVNHSSGNDDPNVGAGDLFDAVTQNLKLGRGEMRLFGVTDQILGTGKFKPEATQTRRQTLVVVHLNPPKLPKAQRDLNAYQDKANPSDLDLEVEGTTLEKTFDARIKP